MGEPGIELRPAIPSDARRVFEWATASDATPSMMGPPYYPDHPPPTWDAFRSDYHEAFFQPAGDGHGRLFIISADQRDVGCISYDGLRNWRGVAELDIWLPNRADWGCGWGTAAIRQLSDELLRHAGVQAIIMRPSARNARAIAAYQRAGLRPYDARSTGLPPELLQQGNDYDDAVVLWMPRDST